MGVLVLRKWPAAWGLLLVVSAATLLPTTTAPFMVLGAAMAGGD